MTKQVNAGFKLRLLASLNEVFLFLLPHTLFWLYLATSENLSQLIYRIVLYLTLILLPLGILGFFYSSLLIYHLGANIGKLLTGLKIVGDKDQKLTFKRILFRQTIGYQFSWVFFGLGYLSMTKDPNKQAWHDKAVGSQVIIAKPLWPLALTTLLVFLIANIYIISQTVGELNKGRLTEEINQLKTPNNSKLDLQLPSADQSF